MNIAEKMVEKFGTQEKLAAALGLRQSNIAYWVHVARIPSRWHVKIVQAAGQLGIPISPSDFLDAPTIPDTDVPKVKSDRPVVLSVISLGKLRIGEREIPCAVLSNGKRVIFQSEIVVLLTGHRKGGLGNYLQASNLRPFLPEKFKSQAEDAAYRFIYASQIAHGLEGTDLIEICDMYLKARQAGELLDSQKDLALQAEIITRAFAKLGIVAAIDEATGYQKQRDEYQRLLSKYIAEELQPWLKTFDDNFYFQIYRLKGWDWGRHSKDGKNHPWQVASITNRIVYEKLPAGVLAKLKELSPKSSAGHRKSKLFQGLTPNAGYVHLVKHLGFVESILERHADGNWMQALYEIDKRFPSYQDPWGNPFLPL